MSKSKDMYYPRPALKLELPDGVKLYRLEAYRTRSAWWKVWKPKYNHKMYAICEKGEQSMIYDITEVVNNA